MMDFAREDRTIAGLVHPAELLHHRCRQADLVAGDRAPARCLLDLLIGAPDRISLIEARWVDFRGQYFGRPAAAEQFNDALALLPRIEFRHKRLRGASPRS